MRLLQKIYFGFAVARSGERKVIKIYVFMTGLLALNEACYDFSRSGTCFLAFL